MQRFRDDGLHTSLYSCMSERLCVCARCVRFLSIRLTSVSAHVSYLFIHSYCLSNQAPAVIMNS